MTKTQNRKTLVQMAACLLAAITLMSSVPALAFDPSEDEALASGEIWGEALPEDTQADSEEEQAAEEAPLLQTFSGFALFSTNVADNILINSLVVRLDGNIIYQHGEPPITSGITLRPNSVMTFSLAWEVNDKNYIFRDGDSFTIDIVEMTNLGLVTGNTIPLTIDGLHVANGQFTYTNNVLRYAVTFNDNAKQRRVGGGSASGSAELQIQAGSGTVDLTFEDEFTGTYNIVPQNPDPPAPPTGSGIPGWERPEIPEEPFTIVSMEKGASNPGNTNGVLNIGQMKRYEAIPDRGGETFYGIDWRVTFSDLVRQLEGQSTPTDYVIFEDTIGPNQAFSNYVTPDDGNPGSESPPIMGFYKNGQKKPLPYPFYFEIPVYAYGSNQVINLNATGGLVTAETSDSSPTSFIRICDVPMTQAVINAADALTDTSEAHYKANTPVVLADYDLVDTYVRENPLTWAIIPTAEGSERLLINLGQMGQNVSAGEGLNGNMILSGWTPVEYIIDRTLVAPILWAHKTVDGLGRGTDTPYTHLMALLNRYDALINDSRFNTNYWVSQNDNDVRLHWGKYMNDVRDFVGDGSLLTPVSAAATPPAVFTSAHDDYPQISQFTKQYTSSAVDIEKDVYDVGMALEKAISSYATEMNYLVDNYADIIASNTNRRDSYLTTLFFYFPELKAIILDQDHLNGTGGGTNYLSGLTSSSMDGEFIAAIGAIPYSVLADGFKDDTLNWATENRFCNIGRQYHTQLNGPIPMPIMAVSIRYRTIITDLSDPRLDNRSTITTGLQTFEDQVVYRHAFAADIYGKTPGAAIFIKLDDAVYNKNTAVTSGNFDAYQGLAGAQFKVYTTQACNGTATKFSVTANAGIYTLDPGGSETLTAGPGGVLELQGLSDGTYYLKETVAPTGYYLLESPVTFTVDSTQPLYYGAFNTPRTVQLIKYKSGGGTGNPGDRLGGAVFSLYQSNHTQLTGFELRSGVYYYTGSGTNTDLTVPAGGMLEVRGLPAGAYYFKEKTPPAGYALDQTPVPFELKADLSDYSGSPIPIVSLANSTSPIPEIKIIKKSYYERFARAMQGIEPLPGVTFTLEQLTGGSYLESTVTNSNGEAVFPALSSTFAGRYILTETPPTNHTPVGTVWFTIGENGTVSDITYGNDRDSTLVSFDDSTANLIAITLHNKRATPTLEKPKGNLEITKTVTGSGADLNLAFNFTVSFSDGGTYSYTITGGAGGNGSITGSGTLRLAHGQTARFEDISAGVTYTVTETAVSNYTPTPAGGTESSIIADSQTATALFNNHYTPSGGEGPDDPGPDPDEPDRPTPPGPSTPDNPNTDNFEPIGDTPSPLDDLPGLSLIFEDGIPLEELPGTGVSAPLTQGSLLFAACTVVCTVAIHRRRRKRA